MTFNVSFKASSVKFDTQLQFNGSAEIPVEFANLQRMTEYKDVEMYEGEYDVTPKVNAQTLPTAQKFMVDDVQINAIPYHDVSNTVGGRTIYIAKEI